MKPGVVRLAALAVGAWALASVAAGEHVVRRRVLLGGDHGSVTVEMPSGWRFESFRHDSPPSATVRFGPDSDAFDFRLGLSWVEPSMRVPLTTVKERVRLAANDALLRSVETGAQLLEIRGKGTAGYYYALRDRSPGEYPYLTQGIAVTGPVTNVFTLFSRSDDPAERERALRLIASATWSEAPKAAAPAAPALPAGQDPVSLRIDEVNDTYRLTVPVSHFVLTIRKGGLKRATNPAIQSSRYFLLKDAAHGTVVSGFFDFAKRFEGLDKFWEHETSSMKQRSSAAPEDVKFKKVGAWDAIVYNQPVPGGTSAHVRAEWVAEGTWIDVHLSLTGKRQPADAQDTLLQLLGTFLVEDKD